MGGGLMQLVAYGAQDIYLTGNPQITFFKVVYRRHTNFSMETIQQTISGNARSAAASGTTTGTVTISRNGDLVHKVYVRGQSSSGVNISADGTTLIKEVELEIGGQRIDRQTTEWMQVWNELTTPPGRWAGLQAMTGSAMEWGGNDGKLTSFGGVNYCHIPLQFWFCRNPGLALPLIALQYHEVKLKFTWAAMTTAVDCSVWCDYIYLDTDERRRFAQVSHEYLIEQIQIQSGSSAASQKLNFNHPVKELIWTEATVTQTYDNKTKLQLNGHDRFSEQVQEYFLLRQPYDYHTNVPYCNLPMGSGLDTASNLNPRHHNVRGSPVKVGSSGDSTDVASWNQPANSIITGIELSCTKAVTLSSSGKVGFKVGTSPTGVDIVAADDDGVIATGSSVVVSFCAGPLTLVGNGLGTGAVTSVNYTATKRPLYFNITTDVGAAADSGGEFEFRVTFKKSPPHTTLQYGHGEAMTSQYQGLINCYSFALKPEEHQPSGTCNFSRIDNAKLMFTGGTGPTVSNIYAVNYNVLRIMSGMGGLAYSN